MFPLVHRNEPNPLELFQIWLNLPSADKRAEPHFAMLWDDTIPRHVERDDAGRRTEVVVVAGRIGNAKAPPPPPRSWAARADTDVAIWTIKMEPNARWTLPRTALGSNRTLYFFRGSAITIAGANVAPMHGVELRADADVAISNGPDESQLLLLQGRPIGEPVAQHGPFVMNSRAEILEAFQDYQRTQFGGWPWKSDGPVHPREKGRFAIHADGKIEAREELEK